MNQMKDDLELHNIFSWEPRSRDIRLSDSVFRKGTCSKSGFCFSSNCVEQSYLINCFLERTLSWKALYFIQSYEIAIKRGDIYRSYKGEREYKKILS